MNSLYDIVRQRVEMIIYCTTLTRDQAGPEYPEEYRNNLPLQVTYLSDNEMEEYFNHLITEMVNGITLFKLQEFRAKKRLDTELKKEGVK